MNIEIDRYSPSSLVQQIYDAVYGQINTGVLTKGMALLSIRSLASKLGVSMVTVSKAYNALETEGLITTVRGKGTFVKKTVDAEKIDSPSPTIADRFDWQKGITDYVPKSLYFPASIRPGYGYRFDVSRLHHELFPAAPMPESLKNVLEQESVLFSPYEEVQGDSVLRNQLAASFSDSGIKATGKEIMITNGRQQGIDLVSRAFLGPEDVVLAESPVNPAVLACFRSRGAIVLPVPADEQGIQTETLGKLCKKFSPKFIYCCPSFSDPAGAVLSQERRETVLHLAKKHNIIILEEEASSELYFHTPPPPPVKSLDEGGHVIYLKGISNLVFPGMKMAGLMANGYLLQRLLTSAQLAGTTVSLQTQKGMLHFLQSGQINEYYEKLRVSLALRCERVLDLLKEHAPHEVSWKAPDGGVNIWITCPYWFNADLFSQKAASNGIFILPGSSFYPAEPEYNHFRVNFSYLPEDQLEEGVTLLSKLLSDEINTNYNYYFLSY